MNIQKILGQGEIYRDNNVRRLLWFMSWRDKTGAHAKQGQYKTHRCRMCGKVYWVKAELNISVLDRTCSKKCFLELEQLRADNHWS